MIKLIMMTKLLEEKSKNCRRRNILQRDELIRKEVVRGTFFNKYNFSPFLLLQFAKIGQIAGDRQDSGVLETNMEGWRL